MKKLYRLTKVITVFNLLLMGIAHGQVQTNSLFSNHMVLQRDVEVPVWGTAAEGEQVTVSFNGQNLSTRATGGKWLVKLKKLRAGGPYAMTISASNTISIDDVLVGDVWLCSGQSNMERQLGPRNGQKPIDKWEQERDNAQYPQIREYYVPLKYSGTPVLEIGSKWQVCSPQTVSAFSAVGYFFAKNLYKDIKVPIGILFSAYGGTPAEHWTTQASLENNPELQVLIKNYASSLRSYPERLAAYQKELPAFMEKFIADSAAAKQASQPLPRKPVPPTDPTKRMIAGLYNGMIAGLVPYALKGACWYQGEANSDRGKQYQSLLPAMIDQWRKDWSLGDFPFLIVQIAPFKTMTPEIREAQLIVSQKTKNTGLIVTTDCGDSGDIHPSHKQPVGERLALAARALAYGQKIEYSGPIYKSIKIMGSKAALDFTHTGKGLVPKDGELQGFTIAASDKQFVPAKAIISGKQIIVSSDTVKEPVAVRFGWAPIPVGNLFNKDGLPASPFRTDPE